MKRNIIVLRIWVLYCCACIGVLKWYHLEFVQLYFVCMLFSYHNDFIIDASYSEEYDKNIYFFDSIDGNETTINNIESNEHNINSDDSTMK